MVSARSALAGGFFLSSSKYRLLWLDLKAWPGCSSPSQILPQYPKSLSWRKSAENIDKYIKLVTFWFRPGFRFRFFRSGFRPGYGFEIFEIFLVIMKKRAVLSSSPGFLQHCGAQFAAVSQNREKCGFFLKRCSFPHFTTDLEEENIYFISLSHLAVVPCQKISIHPTNITTNTEQVPGWVQPGQRQCLWSSQLFSILKWFSSAVGLFLLKAFKRNTSWWWFLTQPKHPGWWSHLGNSWSCHLLAELP